MKRHCSVRKMSSPSPPGSEGQDHWGKRSEREAVTAGCWSRKPWIQVLLLPDPHNRGGGKAKPPPPPRMATRSAALTQLPLGNSRGLNAIRAWAVQGGALWALRPPLAPQHGQLGRKLKAQAGGESQSRSYQGLPGTGSNGALLGQGNLSLAAVACHSAFAKPQGRCNTRKAPHETIDLVNDDISTCSLPGNTPAGPVQGVQNTKHGVCRESRFSSLP